MRRGQDIRVLGGRAVGDILNFNPDRKINFDKSADIV